MALALTLLSIFTLVGLILSAVSGWALSHAIGGSVTAARHIAVAIPTALALGVAAWGLLFTRSNEFLLGWWAGTKCRATGRSHYLTPAEYERLQKRS